MPDDLRDALNRLHGPPGGAASTCHSRGTQMPHTGTTYTNTPKTSICNTAQDVGNRFLGAHLLEYRYGVPTIYEPSKKTIGDLLSDPSRKTAVPDYQRDYSWSESHIDYFWQDLMEFKEAHNEISLRTAEYFVGSMVRVESDSGYELLDGQQRLATAVILLSAIRDRLKSLNTQASQRTDDKWIVDHDDLTDKRTYSLTLGRYDRDYFRRRIQDKNGNKPAADTESQKLINAARLKFDREIEAQLNKCRDEKSKTDWLLLLRSALVDHVTTVTVTCASEDEAASIFETLNDRGLGL